jgi:hypothetical protein
MAPVSEGGCQNGKYMISQLGFGSPRARRDLMRNDTPSSPKTLMSQAVGERLGEKTTGESPAEE